MPKSKRSYLVQKLSKTRTVLSGLIPPAGHTTLLVIWILGRVYGLIFPVKVYILPSRQARENIHFDREYESIYPAKNPYNEYVLLQSDQFEIWTIKELEGQGSWGKKESWVKKIFIYHVQYLSGISVYDLKEQLYLFLKL